LKSFKLSVLAYFCTAFSLATKTIFLRIK